MALKTTYKDVTWNGMRKYTMLNNSDGTMSFVDKTIYTNEADSLFGAKDVNLINSTINELDNYTKVSTTTINKFKALGMQ